MNRIFKQILFFFLLAGSLNPDVIILAEQSTKEKEIDRNPVEYKSSDLRDPFKQLIFKEEKKDLSQNINANQAQVNFSSLKVQGIIWGGLMPQAIINNKVVTVGDLIEGAEILNIDKNGITLISSGIEGYLAAPGKSYNSSQPTTQVSVGSGNVDSADQEIKGGTK